MWLKLNQPKNKAQKQVQEFAQQMDNCLLNEAELKNFRNRLDARIKEINVANPRCADINKSGQHKDGYIVKEYWLAVSDAGVHFSFREVERFELSETTGRDPIYDLMGDMKADAH